MKALLPACLLAGTTLLARAEEPKRPNIVFILADDLGCMDIGAYNAKTLYETPHIDRLAASGMRFTSGYAASPVCSPTRASILTGKSPLRLGITDWIRKGSGIGLPLAEVTIAETLRAAGYANFFAGKWHLGEHELAPMAHGFSTNLVGQGEFYYPPRAQVRVDGDYKSSDRIADEAVRFIEVHRDQPFFAYLPFLAPHVPIQSPPELTKRYERKLAEAAPGSFGGQTNAVYAGMLEQMDSGIGRVLDALERLKLTERTVVVFTSDNGGFDQVATCNRPLRGGKGAVYEGGIREPWIVRAPGVTKPGSVCDSPVITHDFYPTLLELVGLPAMPTQHVDGVSFVPLLRGETLERGPLYWHYPHPWRISRPSSAIREGDWKLVETLPTKKLELFNLRDDSGETNDLAGAQPAKLKELHAKLAAWRAQFAPETQ